MAAKKKRNRFLNGIIFNLAFSNPNRFTLENNINSLPENSGHFKALIYIEIDWVCSLQEITPLQSKCSFMNNQGDSEKDDNLYFFFLIKKDSYAI